MTPGPISRRREADVKRSDDARVDGLIGLLTDESQITPAQFKIELQGAIAEAVAATRQECMALICEGCREKFPLHYLRTGEAPFHRTPFLYDADERRFRCKAAPIRAMGETDG